MADNNNNENLSSKHRAGCFAQREGHVTRLESGQKILKAKALCAQITSRPAVVTRGCIVADLLQRDLLVAVVWGQVLQNVSYYVMKFDCHLITTQCSTFLTLHYTFYTIVSDLADLL